MAASEGIEKLAEDGDPGVLVDSLQAVSGVLSAGAANTPNGSTEPGPIAPGGSYSFTVTTDGENPYLSIASMVVPSNDTFIAFDPSGIRLLSEAGESRSAEDIAADVEAQLRSILAHFVRGFRASA